MSNTLRALFERALKVSLSCPLILSGCGPVAVDARAFDRPECSNGVLSIGGLSPTKPVDYTELRVQSPRIDDQPRALNSSGTRCATASDKAACEAAIGALVTQSGFLEACFQICSRYSLVTSSADTITPIDSQAALKAFLGPIDTPQEALLIAFAEGYSISCQDKQRGAVKRVGDGFEVIGTKGYACGVGTSVKQYLLGISATGEVSRTSEVVLEVGRPDCVIGRRPPGLHLAMPEGDTALGRHFANATQLESAAVHAFVRLFHELEAHEAPYALRARAMVGAADEVRHARSTLALARRFGGRPRLPLVAPPALRSLADVATENAVEGCVRETFGALLAHRQALHAADPEIAAELRVIAEEETRHAALSWEIDAWAQHHLGRRERCELAEARRSPPRRRKDTHRRAGHTRRPRSRGTDRDPTG